MTKLPIELDDIDKRIVVELQRDGRISYADLGPIVGLSAAAVRQRVQRILDSGIVKVVGVTDPQALGFPVMAMLGVQVDGDVTQIADTATAADANAVKLKMEARKWVSSKLNPRRWGDRTTVAGDRDNPLVVDGLGSLLTHVTGRSRGLPGSGSDE